MRARLTDALVAELQPEGAQLLVWDTELQRFGVVIGRPARTYFLQWRDTHGRQHRKAIGRHGYTMPDGEVLTAERARVLARAILARDFLFEHAKQCPLCGHALKAGTP